MAKNNSNRKIGGDNRIETLKRMVLITYQVM